ncbi:MAG: GNAT family N-acetyltransferase [Nitrospirota bacterium]|nr:GNAT family N-acetyltransferase [Nitrospirota bacterium]
MQKDDASFEISADKGWLDVAMIHDFLSNRSYWAKGVPRATIERSVENALCFGVYCGGQQVGFARVVTDFATIAYLGDVFILEPHRGKGLGKRLVRAIMDHPELQGLRLWILGTQDAHELYRKFGFHKLKETPLLERFMVIRNPDVSGRGAGGS